MANIIINDNPEFSTEMEAFTPKTFANAEEWNTRFKKVIEAAAFLKSYIDTAYENSNSYTDSEIAELIGGAPELRNTLKELSDAIDGNKTLADLLTDAIGKKANQTELDTHTNNGNIHITTTDKTNWNEGATTAQQAKEAVDTLNSALAQFKNELNNNLQQVRTYVGEDEKLHFVDSTGADSVLPFSGCQKSVVTLAKGCQQVEQSPAAVSKTFSVPNGYSAVVVMFAAQLKENSPLVYLPSDFIGNFPDSWGRSWFDGIGLSMKVGVKLNPSKAAFSFTPSYTNTNYIHYVVLGLA